MLQEVREEIGALKERLAALEARISSLQPGDFQADDEAVDFTDIEIGVEEPVGEPAVVPTPVYVEAQVPFEAAEPVAEPVAEEPAAEVVAEPVAVPEERGEEPLPVGVMPVGPEEVAAEEAAAEALAEGSYAQEDDLPVADAEPVNVPEVEPVPEAEPVAEPEAAPVAEPEAILEAEPAPAAEPEVASAQKEQPVEDDTLRLPWRTDKPGLPVKNIRSGISLLDRALFIGTLFKEDFARYDQTIADLNTMETLDEAVAYIRENFPNWNLKSDVVYHFMMSIRKKLG